MMRNCFVSKDIRDLLLVPEIGSEEAEQHTDEAYESIFVKISDFEKKKKTIVSCFYCELSRNRNQYLEHIQEVLNKNGDGTQIACGDCNIDFLNETLPARITLENLMTAKGLDLVSLREPSRKTAISSTCIDSIYSNIPVQLTRVKNYIL